MNQEIYNESIAAAILRNLLQSGEDRLSHSDYIQVKLALAVLHTKDLELKEYLHIGMYYKKYANSVKEQYLATISKPHEDSCLHLYSNTYEGLISRIERSFAINSYYPNHTLIVEIGPFFQSRHTIKEIKESEAYKEIWGKREQNGTILWITKELKYESPR